MQLMNLPYSSDAVSQTTLVFSTNKWNVPGVILRLREQNILQNLIKINISSIQQTQSSLKTIIDKLLFTFL